MRTTYVPTTLGEAPLSLAGASEPVRRARESFELAVSQTTPVLIVSEAGSRARETAESLHGRTRAGAPFVAVECGALQPADLEGRLFGVSARRVQSSELETIGGDAAIAEAGPGTLFLEQIEELPASAQRRLVRVLRDGEVRVSGRHTRLPMRLVASTVRDLDADVREGRFRQDLLRRLSACRIAIPPLRHRPADVAEIVAQLVNQSGGPPRSFTRAAMTVLAALPWAGNIDEVDTLLQKVLKTAGASVTQEDVLAHVPMDGQFSRVDLTASLRDARRRFERDYIAAVLERHQWRMSEAARALGIERANLYRKTRQLGIVRAPRVEVS
jgi:DNA-binding NtrC family response regulator